MTAAMDKNAWIELLRKDLQAFQHQRAMVRALDPAARLDLLDVDLTGRYLRKADLKDTNLTRANLTNTDMRLADLRGAKLQQAVFAETHLEKALMQKADLRNTSLQGAYLQEAQMQEVLFSSREQVVYAQRQGAILGDTVNINNEIIPLKVPAAPAPVVAAPPAAPAASAFPPRDITSELAAIIKNTPQKLKARLDEYKKTYPNERLPLARANFYGQNHLGINLGHAHLYESNLQYVNFSSKASPANFGGAQVSKSLLRGTNLGYANCRGTAFRESDLTGANFYGADLSGAAFDNAILQGVDLRGATLTNAIFKNADARGAIFSSPQQVVELQRQGAQLDADPMIIPIEASTARTPNTTIQGRAHVAHALEVPKAFQKGFPPVSRRERSDKIELYGASKAEAAYAINYHDSEMLASLLSSHNLRPVLKQAFVDVLQSNNLVDSEVVPGTLSLSQNAAPTVSETLTEAASLEFIPYKGEGYVAELGIDISKWRSGIAAIKQAYPNVDAAVLEQLERACFSVFSEVMASTRCAMVMPGELSQTVTAERFIYQMHQQTPMQDSGAYKYEAGDGFVGWRVANLAAEASKAPFIDLPQFAIQLTDYSREKVPGAFDFTKEFRPQTPTAPSSPQRHTILEGLGRIFGS